MIACRVGLAGAVLALVAMTGSGSAWAAKSAGCTAVNNGALNGSIDNGTWGFRSNPIRGFVTGDKLTFNVTANHTAATSVILSSYLYNNGVYTMNLVDGGTGFTNMVLIGTGTETAGPLDLSPTEADEVETDFSVAAFMGGTFSGSLTVTCDGPDIPEPASSDSLKLRSLQKSGTKTGAQVAGGAYSGIIGDAISRGMTTANGTIQPPQAGGRPAGISGLGMGEGRNVETGAGRRSRLTPWVNGRFSESGDDSTIDWQHTTVAAGASYAVAPDLLVGVFGGYEKLDFEQNDIDGDLDGDGRTAGAYLAWLLAPKLRLDGAIAHTWLDYDATAGTASGDFDGKRWLFLTRLSGDHVAGRWTFTPSAEVFWLHETQDAYTDSLGTLQAKNSFTNGRANAGLQAAHAIPLSPSTVLVPYAGIYGDYYFGMDDDGTALSVIGIGDGWAARATGGLTLSGIEGWSLMLGAEAGNLGGEGPEFWTGRLGGSVNF